MVAALRRARVAGTVCVLAVAVPAPAAAFCRTNTCEQEPDNPDCQFDPVTGCLSGGEWLYWDTSCVAFSVQANASPLRHITYGEAVDTVFEAMSLWADARCDGEPVAIEPVLFPAVACDKVEFNINRSEGPNANVWMFRDDEWPYDDEVGVDTLALTSVWFNVETGQIYDADVEINSHDTALDGKDGPTLLEIASHEAGHVYGLAHSSLPDAIMFTMYSPTAAISASLTRDDEQGICSAYPPGPTAAACDPTPRNGFGPECGGKAPSCQAAGPAKPRDGAIWAAAAALLLFRGRRSTGRPARLT